MSTIRQALLADAPALAALATNVFRESYGSAIPDDILTTYLARTFTAATFETMICAPNSTLLVAVVNKMIGGYCKLTGAQLPPNMEFTAPDYPRYSGSHSGHSIVELGTLYIDRTARGNGMGQALMRAALDWAMAQGYTTMWLCVWQENKKAQTFYERLGFIPIGTTEIIVDGVVFHDWVMARATSLSPTAIK